MINLWVCHYQFLNRKSRCNWLLFTRFNSKFFFWFVRVVSHPNILPKTKKQFWFFTSKHFSRRGLSNPNILHFVFPFPEAIPMRYSRCFLVCDSIWKKSDTQSIAISFLNFVMINMFQISSKNTNTLKKKQSLHHKTTQVHDQLKLNKRHRRRKKCQQY